MKTVTLSLSTILFLGLGALASAQQAAQETLQQRTELPGGTAGSSQPSSISSSSDLGSISVIQEYPVPSMFTVFTTQEVFYTNNVFLTDVTQTGSAVYHGSYHGAFIPYSTAAWTPQISFTYDMFRYGKVSVADFDSATLDFSGKYVFGKDRSWSWTPRIALSQFISTQLPGSTFYKEVTYDNQVYHEQKILQNLYLDTGYNLTYRQTTPGIYTRLDNALTVGLSYLVTPQWVIQPFFRPACYTYVNDTAGYTDRNDFNLTTGVDVTWKPNKYCSFSGDVIDTRNFSSASGNTYNATIPGLSVTGTFSF